MFLNRNVGVVSRLKGGYRALDMGYPHEAMVDMTGGVAEVLNTTLSKNLPDLLGHLLAKGALINCATNKVRLVEVYGTNITL